MKYALINKADGKLIKKAKSLPTIDNTIPKDLDASLEWLEVVEKAKPAFDETTHKLEVIESKVDGKWEESNVKVALSEDEVNNIQRMLGRESLRLSIVSGIAALPNGNPVKGILENIIEYDN